MPTADLPHIDDSGDELLRRRSFDRYMCWDANLPGSLVERIWRDPHALLADGVKLQDKLRCTVVRVDDPAGPFVWKHHNWGSLRRTVKRSLSQSAAAKSWIDARLLRAAGVPTPRPRAYVERRLGPFKICSYLLTDFVEGTSLYRLTRFGRPTQQFVRHLAQQVAAIWQQLNDLCVCHNDFKTENLLIDPQGKVWLIDFERMRHCRRRSELHRRQVRDAGDLLHPRNWRANPGVAELFRQEILQTPAAKETLAGRGGVQHPLSRPVHPENRAAQLVTVLIPCRNAAHTIVTCLESVRDMADEILVADAGSTDDTLHLVRQFGGCEIIEREGPVDAAFETWAHSHVRHPWILRILPDEQLNPELSRQVQDLLAREPTEDGFRVARTYYFRTHRLKHGGFHRHMSIRLYRKSAGRYEMRDGRVEAIVPSRRVGRFKPRLYYQSCFSFDRHLKDVIRAAARAAEDGHGQGISPKCRNVLWRAPWQFLKTYILRGGWLDGWAGLQASWSSALAICLREMMLWEMHQPAAAARSVVSDSRQELTVFDPDRVTVPAAAALTTQSMAPDGDAAVGHSDVHQRRSAA